MSEQEIAAEIAKCKNDPVYFHNNYVVDEKGNKPKPITKKQWELMERISRYQIKSKLTKKAPSLA